MMTMFDIFLLLVSYLYVVINSYILSVFMSQIFAGKTFNLEYHYQPYENVMKITFL